VAWEPVQRPTELAEGRLVEAILSGQFSADSSLPAERDLASRLGVSRPTLRDALQRLARDGWVEIRHGRPTRVRDFWHEGNLAVLGAIARHQDPLPNGFVASLLEVRLALAPAYTRLAIERSAPAVADLLEDYSSLPDSAETFASADWHLHHVLALGSGNAVFTLILNGFGDLYLTLAQRYFASPGTRQHSREFYLRLLAAARAGDAPEAEYLTRQVMAEALELWERIEWPDTTPGQED
jgi:GntR family negative regulator for fad regulon and positive regulator of fabA